MIHFMKPAKIYLLLCSLAVLYGCATSPDSKLADVSAAPAPTQQGEVRKPVSARDISTEWWVLFKSPPLSELIQRAFKANPDTGTTRATLLRIQENSVIQHGYFYPGAGAASLPMRKIPVAKGCNASGRQGKGRDIYNLCSSQLTVGYAQEVLDTNPAKATPIQTEMQQKAAHFTLSSNVVAAAIQESSLRAQIGAQLYIVGLNRQELEIVHNQFKLGYVSEDDVTQRELNAALAQQALVPLQQQFEQTRNLLLALTGNEPDPDRDSEDAFALDELNLPRELPQSLPSKLVEQRPDVRVAEAELKSVGARYGLKVIYTLPLFTVTGATGGVTSSPTWMLEDGGSFFDMNENVAQYIYGANAVRSRSRTAQQALNRAATQYRNVVMTALHDLADTLKVIRSDTRVLDEVAQTALSASKTGESVRKNYEAGSVDFQSLRTAQRNEQLANIKLAQAQANWMGVSVALLQALGGRWWTNAETDDTAAKQPLVN